MIRLFQSVINRVKAIEEFDSKEEQVSRVHCQNLNGRSANRRKALYVSLIEPKVFGPQVDPRIKETNKDAGVRINSSNVRTFEPIAVEASES